MKFLKDLMPYLIIIIIVILIRTFIVTPVRVSGESMYPTLDGGEIMILDKISKIKRFDVVVVTRGNDDESLIKRVIGLPGETVEIKEDLIYVDGKVVEDNYGYYDPDRRGSEGATFSMPEILLDEDEYFVLGDNRLNSIDSHIFGAVKKKEIKGKTNFIIYPFNRFGKLKTS